MEAINKKFIIPDFRVETFIRHRWLATLIGLTVWVLISLAVSNL